ncbi:hypothetical protein BDZ89DRAFT_1129433 [Hymenopellis radicata]|nr:hypothetical protein BDZ89DRAFT_1129433 [Hymenopellis radicata]
MGDENNDEESDATGSENESDLDDDNAESSEEDVDVQPSAKKRKLNSGDAGVSCETELSQSCARSQNRRKRANKRARRSAAASITPKDDLKLSQTRQAKRTETKANRYVTFLLLKTNADQ